MTKNQSNRLSKNPEKKFLRIQAIKEINFQGIKANQSSARIIFFIFLKKSRNSIFKNQTLSIFKKSRQPDFQGNKAINFTKSIASEPLPLMQVVWMIKFSLRKNT